MKKPLLSLCLLLGVLATRAQNVCINFDDCNVQNVNEREHTFDIYGNGHPGCLSDWEVVSGTPSIFSTTLATPYTGSSYALFGIHNNGTAETAALKYNFQTGQSYRVSMAIYNYNGVPINTDFYLLDAAIPYTYNYNVGASALPAVPAGSLKVDSVVSFTTQAWTVISFTTPVLSKDFSRFWIRQYGASSNYLFVDSMCITKVEQSTCINFDDCNVQNVNEREHTFDIYGNGHPGCLSNWEVVSGTPSIFSTTLATPYTGSSYALFGIHNNSTAETAALKHSFLSGHQYTFRMAIYNYNGVPINTDFYLLDAAIPYTYNYNVGASALPAVPAGSLKVDSVLGYTTQAWTVISFTTPVLSKDFSRFWIRQYGASSNYLFVDELCISDAQATGIENPVPQANGSALFQSIPNPSSGSLVIPFYIAEKGSKAAITLHDLSGKLCKRYDVSDLAGTGKLGIADGELPKGIYFYSLQVNGENIATQKLLIAE